MGQFYQFDTSELKNMPCGQTARSMSGCVALLLAWRGRRRKEAANRHITSEEVAMRKMRMLLMLCMVMGFIGQPVAAEPVLGDTVIQEGIGLPKLHLGESYDEVIHDLGQPTEDLYGFVFVYRLPNNAELNFRITDDKVVAVNFKGNAKTTYTTGRGAKFDMTRKQVEEIYGLPEAEAVNTLFYYRQGISFLFDDNGKLYEINVFPMSRS